MSTVFSLLLAGFAGVMTWSFLEYVIHRWLGHHPRLLRNPFGREHMAHHSKGDYFAPSWKKALAAAVVVVCVAPPAVWLAGWGVGAAYTVGFVAFYLCYEVLHRLEHTWQGLGAYGRWARRHHFHHHFHNPRRNHGVTSPLWDVVFGTYEAPAHIRVPRKLAMSWLCDPQSGEVWPHLQRDYEVRVRRNKRQKAATTPST